MPILHIAIVFYRPYINIHHCLFSEMADLCNTVARCTVKATKLVCVRPIGDQLKGPHHTTKS